MTQNVFSICAGFLHNRYNHLRLLSALVSRIHCIRRNLHCNVTERPISDRLHDWRLVPLPTGSCRSSIQQILARSGRKYPFEP